MKAAFLLALLVAASASPQPIVRVHIDGAQPVLVGQQVRVDVQILAPNFFLSPPPFPALDIPGAVATLIDDRALNTTETIDGTTYAGIQKTYAITPQQPGELRLPPVQISFTYAAEPGKPGVPASVTLPPQSIVAKVAGGAASPATSGPVAKLVVTQTLDREVAGLKAGEALTRTIETFAPNTQAMMIPPPQFEAPAGVRMYRRDPSLGEVKDEHGAFTGGRRVDRVTYVFEKPGHYTLPAVEIGWIDAATGKRAMSRADAIALDVAASAAETSPLAPVTAPRQLDVDWRHAGVLIGVLALLLAAGALARHYAPRIEGLLTTRRLAHEQSEIASFDRLTHACEANDAIAAYRALFAWARHQGLPGLDALKATDPRLRAEVQRLERSLYAHTEPSTWSGGALATACARARTSMHGDRRTSRRIARGRNLPALNP